MNKKKLKQAREAFLRRYPLGFQSREMEEMGKKHKAEQLYALASETFNPDNFKKKEKFIGDLVKFVSRVSVVSVFEKTKFRDFMKNALPDERDQLMDALYEFIHGNGEKGVILYNDVLGKYKLAKWTILTACLAYYRPKDEVFIKPTTVKKAISLFELDDISYSPKISYDFYTAYREKVREMKKVVSLTDDSLAFGGFIMLSEDLI